MTTGIFNYIDHASVPSPDTSSNKPWNKVDVHKTSFKTVALKRSVTNIRELAASSTFGTDISGFDFFRSPISDEDFSSDAVVRDKYYADIKALLRNRLPGIKEIVIFDHTVRRREKTSPRQPVQLLHVDQTPAAAEARVRRHISNPTKAEELLRHRYQIINVWRPIKHAASDFPLAVVDWRSTQPEDLVKVDLMYPKRAEGMMVTTAEEKP